MLIWQLIFISLFVSFIHSSFDTEMAMDISVKMSTQHFTSKLLFCLTIAVILTLVKL